MYSLPCQYFTSVKLCRPTRRRNFQYASIFYDKILRCIRGGHNIRNLFVYYLKASCSLCHHPKARDIAYHFQTSCTKNVHRNSRRSLCTDIQMLFVLLNIRKPHFHYHFDSKENLFLMRHKYDTNTNVCRIHHELILKC